MENHIIVCPRCKNACNSDANFCTKCGQPFAKKQSNKYLVAGFLLIPAAFLCFKISSIMPWGLVNPFSVAGVMGSGEPLEWLGGGMLAIGMIFFGAIFLLGIGAIVGSVLCFVKHIKGH